MEPVYHTLQPRTTDGSESPPTPEDGDKPEFNLVGGNNNYAPLTPDDVEVNGNHKEMYALNDLDKPPSMTTAEKGYEPGQQDGLLWNSPFDSYPVASMSRDAYGLDEDDDDDDEGTIKCGWGRFTPKCMQACMNIKAYLVVFAMVGMVQVMTSYGLVTVAITTIERRFELTSFQSGSIMSAYQFTSMAFTVFITYIGEHRHKPRLVAMGSLFLTLGSVVFTLPHFLSGPYEYQEQGTSADGVCPVVNLTGNSPVDMCDSENQAETGGSGEDPSQYYWLFILGQLFNSLAAAPLFTLGITYFDDNLSTKNFAMYMGIVNALMSFGPAAGYFIGVITLSLYTDFHADMSSVTITPDNPVWVGAWWLGFLISAGLTTILACIIATFPKSLPGQKRIQRERRNQTQKGSEFVARPGFAASIRDFPRALWKIVRNVPFICLCMAAVTEYFIAVGFVVFLPKFLETQFNMNSGDVGIYVGVIAMSTHFTGAIGSGVLIKKMDLAFRGLVRVSIIFVLLMMCTNLAFIMYCPNPPMAGVTVSYINTSIPLSDDGRSLLHSCNLHCACPDSFEPVCGDDDVMYFTPCHAGCTSESLSNGTMVYYDCRCIIPPEDDVIMRPWEAPLSYGGAVPGRCQTQCSKQWLYLVLLWLSGTFGTVTSIAAWIATMRCVSHSQRAFALGVQSVFYGGLGTAPSPIVFGIIIDKACILWSTSSHCGGSGSCWIYDNESFAHSFLIIILAFKAGSFLFFIICHFCYKPADDDDALDSRTVYGRRAKRVPSTDL